MESQTSRKIIVASSMATSGHQTAFDPEWDSAVPYTVLLSSDGKVLYREMGTADILELRRTILANLPAANSGFSRYWQSR